MEIKSIYSQVRSIEMEMNSKGEQHLKMKLRFIALICLLATMAGAQNTGYIAGNLNTSAYLWAFDIPTNTVGARHDLPLGAFQFVINRGGTIAYIPQKGIQQHSGQLTVYSLITFSSIATIAMPDVVLPGNPIALSPDGSTVYVLSNAGDITSNGTLSAVSTVTNAVTNTYTVGREATDITVDPSGNKVYVTNWSDTSVSVIDVPSSAVSTLTLPQSPPLAGMYGIAAMRRADGSYTITCRHKLL
jgi:hypothetical protein